MPMDRKRDLQERIDRLDRLHRQRIVTSIIPMVLGGAFLIYSILFRHETSNSTIQDTMNKLTYFYLPIFAIVAGATNMIYWYLQTGFQSRYLELETLKYKPEPLYKNSTESLAKNLAIAELKEQLDQLKEAISSTPSVSEEITSTIKKKIEDAAGLELLENFKSQFERAAGIDHIEVKLNEAHSTSAKRLRDEIQALGRRGNVNLALGVFTTVVGLILLTVFIFKNEQTTTEAIPYAVNFFPRLTLVIFIEIFAYFFLRLYKAGLSEIKYFQNELTNIESKQLALITALRCDSVNIISKVVETLAGTERNHILEKGQTTTEIAKIQLEKNQFIEISKALASAIPKGK